MERARRKEMTFEEEATFYQQEASKLFATEKGDSEAPIANNIVRRGMRIIRKAREEIAALREQEQKSPCSLCGYGGKHLDSPPCTKCPAHPKEQETVTNREQDVAPVVHGEWVSDFCDYDPYCSVCKEFAISYEDHTSYSEHYYRTNYCPNCGAKMDGGKDNVQKT